MISRTKKHIFLIPSPFQPLFDEFLLNCEIKQLIRECSNKGLVIHSSVEIRGKRNLGKGNKYIYNFFKGGGGPQILIHLWRTNIFFVTIFGRKIQGRGVEHFKFALSYLKTFIEYGRERIAIYVILHIKTTSKKYFDFASA